MAGMSEHAAAGVDTWVSFATSPERYRHWRLEVDGAVATLRLEVAEDQPLFGGAPLKLNSYDLGVDIELHDAVQRLRFEHPQVGCVVLTSGRPKIFCAGANIPMLAAASHRLKVNFCKFTNETRAAIEDATAHSGQTWMCAVNGPAAGGGYELALACEHILLVDDNSSTVALPEVPLLAVLPGTGGLTRLVDKRRVRRDHADVLCTTAEGVRGRRALEWRLVDELAPPSRFGAAVAARAAALAARSDRPRDAAGVVLAPLRRQAGDDGVDYSTVRVALDRAARTATLTVSGPEAPPPESAQAMQALGADYWPLRMARELDDALLHLRFNEPELGCVVLRTEGDAALVAQHDALLLDLANHPTDSAPNQSPRGFRTRPPQIRGGPDHRESVGAPTHHGDWLAREIVLLLARTLRRLEATSRSLVALVEPRSCFAGTLAELLLAADRSYMLDGAGGDGSGDAVLVITDMNFGALPATNGWTRLQAHFAGLEEPVEAVRRRLGEPLRAGEAAALGLVTFTPDDSDWADEVRLALEERASFSADALTGMEASLRFPGPETLETKVLGRLSAWQNWIFQRPNAVGAEGALQRYGSGERPRFDRARV